MYETELKLIKRRILKLHRSGKLRKRQLCIFGANSNTGQITQILRKLGYEPSLIIDNDSMKWDSYCSRIKVMPVDSIENFPETAVIIYSFFWREMEYQLENLGLGKKNIYVLAKHQKTVYRKVLESYYGRIIYRRLVRKYGNLPIFLCPYTGTGDIYLIGTFWKEYISKEKIEDYIFCVISGACKRVATMFDIRNIVKFKKQEESAYLIQYYTLCPEEINLKILNDGWAQISGNPSEWFRGYKQMNFTELFRRFVFGLPRTSSPQHPVLKDAGKEIERIFEKKHLRKGKTIVLSPYSNTLADLPDAFWEKLAKLLIEKGYDVCTNSSGDTEPPVSGTEPIFFPLDIAPQFMNEAGCFIGIRSGFCDVISGSDAKKIILYDKYNFFYNACAFEYFSLNSMGLCKDAIEIQFDGNNPSEAIHKILSHL